MLVFRVGIMMTETTFWQETATWLLSEQALWLYSWIGLALAMALLAASVVCMTRKAQKLQSKDILQTKRGRPPVHAPAIEKRIREIQRFKETKVFNTLAFGIGIIIAGVVLPGGLLAGIVIWQDWLLPGAPALLLDDAPFLLTETGFGELALFVAQQALSGGLADMLEVYRFSITQLECNPESFAFCGLVVLYRIIASAAVATCLYVTGIILLGTLQVIRTIKYLRDSMAGSTSTPA